MTEADSRNTSVTAISGFAVIALVCAGVLALTYKTTAPAIEENRKAMLIAKLTQVFREPGANAETAPFRLIPAGTSNTGISDVSLYRATTAAGIDATIAEVSVIGYSGPILILVGVLPGGQISGVSIVRHRETPGLGDLIEREKSDWITQFDVLDTTAIPAESWALISDGGKFAGLTGASVTPRAIIRALQLIANLPAEAHKPQQGVLDE